MPNATHQEFLAAREATGPEPVTLWKVLRGYRVDPLKRWTELREQHGDVAHYRFIFDQSYFISHPDGARRVLQDNAANYTKDHGSYAALRKLVGHGLLTSEGSLWLRQRRLAQPAFHRQRIAAMATRMTRGALGTAERWEKSVRTGGTFSMLHEMSRLTLKVVGDALFGDALAAEAGQVGECWDTLNTQLTERFNRKRMLPPILPTKYDRDFRRARATLFRIVDELIARRRAQPGDGDDLLSLLMNARDEDTGEQMDDRQLRDEVVTMLLAGHETTSVALGWAWAFLDQHREVQAKLQNELGEVLRGRDPTAEDFPRLRYTRAVIDEAMRLQPPVYILFRRAQEDDVVCGYRVHKGGVVVMSPLMFHRHPAFWEHPNDFWPERWFNQEAEQRRPRFAYMPFSGGPRQCIGNNFALMEAVIILATLAQRFQARLAPGYRPAPQYLITCRPTEGLPMILEPAQQASTAMASHA